MGIKKPRRVHFRLPVSFLMERRVVEQGQCIREKVMVHRAVSPVQPLSTKIWRSVVRSPSSESVPWERYAIMAMGRTISFAGKPKIKAVKMMPSIPKSLAKGSKNVAK